MTNVALMHGSNDLYGASRVLLEEVMAHQALGSEVTVILPADGPLTEELRRRGAAVEIDKCLQVVRRVKGFSNRPAIKLPTAARAADVVGLWTLALISYLPVLVARRKAHYVSVHEIQGGRIGRLLVAPLRITHGPIQVNSEATAAWLSTAGIERKRLTLAYPAYTGPAPAASRVGGDKLVVALLGRVNGFKGHLTLVDAVKSSGLDRHQIKVILAGGPFPGQERNLHELQAAIAGDDRFDFLGEIGGLHELPPEVTWVATLPSKPEPFGLVPLEAYALGIRSFGYATGGLAESLAAVGGLRISPGATNIGALLKLLRTSSTPPHMPPLSRPNLFTLEARQTGLKAMLSAAGVGVV